MRGSGTVNNNPRKLRGCTFGQPESTPQSPEHPVDELSTLHFQFQFQLISFDKYLDLVSSAMSMLSCKYDLCIVAMLHLRLGMYVYVCMFSHCSLEDTEVKIWKFCMYNNIRGNH